ncbi:hypothetical protein AGDE_15271 [Angomonas deanei]|uniref:RibD C-terminal domain containing protein, putative n=1 Tax=Angomonas deanei TaxID=59799 RepID=A0A7G2CWP8_9TRYP|nr:hypothetical protein AGDE_15271 [Angomonas deanei]CAD2222692.1 RibD C-terminal domain containing protein, putative [Angomonas deanei]|eukprot:EPY19376.1 hypothetical protein AGDE_15271 [Angomonas deanei]
MSNQTRAKVVCHMMVTLDGKINGEAYNCDNYEYFGKTYYDVEVRHFPASKVCIIGRKSNEGGIETVTDLPPLPEGTVISREEDFIVPFEEPLEDGTHWNCIVDPRGVFAPKDRILKMDSFPYYDGDRIVSVVTQKQPSDVFLYYLQQKKIPYIFAGDEKLDCAVAVEKLSRYLNEKIIMLHGGPTLNGSFLKDGVIDELSLLQVPIQSNNPADLPLFTSMKEDEILPPLQLNLLACESLQHSGLWLHYEVKK